MKIAITGGSSYVGQHLVPIASASHTVQYSYFTQDRMGNGIQVDTRSAEQLQNWLIPYHPDVIIHLAGSNRGQDIRNVIVQGATNITQIAEQLNARLIHLSTDVLFDGTKAPYTESAKSAPMHEYGRAKADAEPIIAQHENHAIVRTSLIYGTEMMDAGTTWMKRSIENGESITLFSDHVRNPVWVMDLCRGLLELGSHPHRGILNIAGSQIITRSDYSYKLLQYWGISQQEQVRIAPDTTGRFPKDCRLDITLAQTILSTHLSGVDEVLGKGRIINL